MKNNAKKIQKRKASSPFTELDHAFNDLFSFASPMQIKKGMWGWLKATVCGNYNTDLEESERAFILLLYEHLEIVLEAAHENHLVIKNTLRGNDQLS